MIAFNRPYMAFDQFVEPYQRADDVGYVISEFMWFEGRPFYSASALARATMALVSLASRSGDDLDEDNIDIIFRMPGASGGSFFEIVLRSDKGTFYGGWLWGQDLEVTDVSVNGYRVLLARFEDSQIRFEFSSRHGRYKPTGHLPFGKMMFRTQREALDMEIREKRFPVKNV